MLPNIHEINLEHFLLRLDLHTIVLTKLIYYLFSLLLKLCVSFLFCEGGGIAPIHSPFESML